MVLVPANMSRLSFGPCKKKLFLVPAKFFVFKIVPGGTILNILKNKKFCRDMFKKTKYFAGTKNYKIGPVIMCHICKSSQKWGQRLF